MVAIRFSYHDVEYIGTEAILDCPWGFDRTAVYWIEEQADWTYNQNNPLHNKFSSMLFINF